MDTANEVGIEHINRLTDIQLSKLLHTLLRTEASQKFLEGPSITVPLKITVADGGEDGRIQWVGNPTKTDWLNNKLTIFQNKATNLSATKCYEEILETEISGQQRKLKAQVEEVVLKNGCYILFTTQDLNTKQKKARIAEFRRAIQDAGHANYSTFEIEIYDANKIKDWVNNYIAAVTLVQGFNGIHRPQGFIEWDKWEILTKASENKFQVDSTIGDNMVLLENSILDEKVIRVTGHSGLGKTRLVLETFRNSDLKKSIVYYDLEGNENISEIRNYIISNQDTQSGIIVIDNCDVKSHSILSSIAKPTGNLKIITLGLDDNNSIQDLKIIIDRDNQRTLVKEIVQNKIGSTHQPSDIEYITSISEGYPWMAIRFCDVVLKEGMSELNKIPLDEFIKRLIFGLSPEDEIEYGIIRACSVFSAFGFLDDSFREVINTAMKESLKAQMNFIRTRIYDGAITETKFKETCNKFLKDDIIERRGTYYIVKPTILAINLAADWLVNTDSDKIIAIIQELKQVTLQEKFIERFKDLDQIDKAKDIVAELWGPNSPFGIAEVLNTSWGSLLFRYVVEVNPTATAKALEISFGNMSKEEILKIDAGRRNLVWALEKLCFRKETFHLSAKILYSFAVSENETWGNNSTNQFIQLFQLFLAGTEVSLQERLKIIRWGLSKKDDDYTRIAIQAIGRGLINDRYMRMGGAEKQGSSAPLRDYRPNWNEVSEYWIEIISILTDIACSSNSQAEFAKEKIANAIRSLLRDRQSKILVDSIQKITKVKGKLWPDALNSLKMTLGFEKQLPKNIIDDINFLIDELTPTDVKSQLFLKVTKPEWDSYEKDTEGNFIDKPKLNTEIFAEKLITEKAEWTKYIGDLLEGEQRQGFNFGNKIGELSEDKEGLINMVFDKLKHLKKENQNPEFIAGLLHGATNKKLFEKTIDRFIADDDLRQHTFYLSRVMSPTLEDVEKLFVLVDKFGYSIEQFENFKYGSSLYKLKNDEAINLCQRISQYGNPGKWTALSLLYMLCYRDEEKWKLNIGFFRKLIASGNMTLDKENTKTMDGYYWSDVVIKILKEGEDNEFAIEISKQIIEFCSDLHFNYSFDVYIKNIIIVLFDKYFDQVWEYFGAAIIGDYMTFFHLEHLINGDSFDHSPGLVFRNPERCDIILEWCKKYPKIAPERIAHMMPLAINDNGKIKWHPFSKDIIDHFGDDKEVLRQLTSNMGSFGSVGSRVPYFITQKELLNELVDHPIQRVREWAAGMIDYTETTIRREELDDEEHSIA